LVSQASWVEARDADFSATAFVDCQWAHGRKVGFEENFPNCLVVSLCVCWHSFAHCLESHTNVFHGELPLFEGGFE
jgi:hypothetical protein